MRSRIDESASGNRTLINAVTGKRIAVYELFIWNVAEQNLEVYTGDEGSPPVLTTLTGPLDSFPAQSGLLLPFSGAPHLLCAEGAPLVLYNSGGTQISGFVDYELVEP